MNLHQAKREFVISSAKELIQKFGFLSRTIVWKHLSPGGRSMKYFYWNLLRTSPQFKLHNLGVELADYLMLSSEARALLGDMACVRTRSSTYFDHDEFLMDVILELIQQGFVTRYWTEAELKKDRVEARKILGGDPYDKIPDLVFDLNIKGRTVRVALENERTRKSQERYKKMHYGYRRLKNLDMILFAVSDSATEAALRREFDRQIFSADLLLYGCFYLKEFGSSALGTELRVRGKTSSLERFFSGVCAQASESGIETPENHRNPFRRFSPLRAVSE